jgi:Fe-S-cluster containining protein
MNVKHLDKLVPNLHHREFEKIDCLACANCCKTISPAIYFSDIRRMAAKMKITTSDFINRFLSEDEEGSYVFKHTPCPFLGEDNFCGIYEFRPKACREYPHTDRSRFHQIIDLTVRNSVVCPAVFNLVEKLND